jgi:hypothetical protein
MVKKSVIGLVSIILVVGLVGIADSAYAETLPLPSSQEIFTYPPSIMAVQNANASLARPLGVGAAAEGGDTVSINVALNTSGPVDIYFAIFSADVDPDNVYILKSDYTLQSLSQGFFPWKKNISGPIDEKLFGDISTLALPPGTYTLYLAVTPAGSLDHYYLWSTHFTIRNFTLTADIFGEGSVKTISPGMYCANADEACSSLHKQGETVAVEAIETGDDYKFSSWEGCDSPALGQPDNICRVKMNMDRTVLPTFVRTPVLTKTPLNLDAQYLQGTSPAQEGTNIPLPGSDEISFFFSAQSPQATDILNLKSGDIISVSNDDFGYIGMVSSLPKLQNSQIVVETVQAGTDGFIQDGTMVFEQQLTHADLISVEGMPKGASLRRVKSLDSTVFTVDFDNVDYLIPPDYTSADYLLFGEAQGTVKLNGSVSFELKPFFGLDVGWFVIKSFRLGVTVINEDNLNVEVNGSAKFQFPEVVPKFLKFKFKPKPVCCAIAPVIWIRPVVEIPIGAVVDVSATLATGLYLKNQLDIGLGYKRKKGVYLIWDYSRDVDFRKPTLVGKAEITGYLKPTVNIYINEVAKPYLYVQPYLRASVDYASNEQKQWLWGLYFGLDTGLGGEFRIFKHTFFKAELGPYNMFEVPLAGDIEDVQNDTQPPSQPNGLRAESYCGEGIALHWDSATDNVGVSGYKVYRNGSYIDSVSSTSYFSDYNLLDPLTEYCYNVSAYDWAGNESQKSDTQCATISTCSSSSVTMPPRQVSYK